jgi:uncharacterized membrane protein YadS
MMIAGIAILALLSFTAVSAVPMAYTYVAKQRNKWAIWASMTLKWVEGETKFGPREIKQGTHG